MTNTNKKKLLLTTLLSGLTYGATVAPAMAQAAAEDEIIVTGSRIQRSIDFVGNSPVATVDAIQFERTGSVNTEDLLNSLPQTVPGLDSTSNNPGNGTATIDLRGLGANRTLVLVNGRRTQPTGSAGIVDINTISPALIESVEVLTGGASSVYGADAVAGVVNFILKDDFEGVEANVGYQMTEQGDAGLLDANVTVGANFDDGRGNATVSIGYTDRDALFQGDRDFANISLFDDGNGGLEPGGSSGVPDTSLFGGGLGIIFQPDGSTRDFVTSGQVNDFYNYAPPNYIRLPQERFTLAATGDYEINEHFEVFLEGRFASNNVDSQLAPTPIFQNPAGAGGISLDGNPFLTPETQQLLSDALGSGVDRDGDGIDDTFSGLVRRRLVEVGPRFASDNRDTFQLVTGLRGAVTDSMDYEVFYSEGRTNNSSFQNGNVNRDRFNQALLLADADGDGNVDIGPDGQPSCADGGSNGSTLACAPLNIFGAGNISQAAADFLKTAVSTTDVTIQRVLQGNVFGELNSGFTSSPIGYAFGAEYIENQFEFRPSQDVAASTIAGFNGAPPIAGKIDSTSAYGELSIPLIEDAAFAKSVNLDLAGRVTDFSNGGTQTNYKVGGDWAINDVVRFRGNYNTAVRAPNIGELFSPQGENFPGGSDPCGAEGNPNAATTAICIATGVPAGAVGTVGLNAVSGQVRALDGGNPDLSVEKAETITFGAVVTPGLFDSFSLSADYFDIQIEDAISTIGVNTVLNGCYTGDSGGAGSAFCNLVQRRPDGTIDFVSLSSTNIAGSKLQGIDFAANIRNNTDFLFDGFLGDMTVSYLGTLTLKNESQANPDDDIFDCAGRFGNSCGEPDPKYRHFTTVGFSKGALSTNLTWQMIGSVDEGADRNGSNDPDLQGFTVDDISARHYFDGSVTADLSDNFALTFGARNLLDKKPPIIGDNDEQANTYPATYDVFGRTFFANAKMKF